MAREAGQGADGAVGAAADGQADGAGIDDVALDHAAVADGAHAAVHADGQRLRALQRAAVQQRRQG
ncbi:hypothetical protein AZA_90261 [Nitrospirillum viridazoti Y2]|nr:hypothetical protein AZA_90261 [Nitrospirillum amazonense Y2]